MLGFHLAAAVWFDLRERRIPNPLIVSGLLSGLALALINAGPSGLGTALLGAGTGMIALVPFFLLGVLGAGDAKLMGVIGSFTGAPALLPIGFYTVLAGGVLGLAVLIATGSGLSALASVKHLMFAAGLRAQNAPIALRDAERKPAARLPYAIAIAAGVACWTLTRN